MHVTSNAIILEKTFKDKCGNFCIELIIQRFCYLNGRGERDEDLSFGYFEPKPGAGFPLGNFMWTARVKVFETFLAAPNLYNSRNRVKKNSQDSIWVGYVCFTSHLTLSFTKAVPNYSVFNTPWCRFQRKILIGICIFMSWFQRLTIAPSAVLPPPPCPPSPTVSSHILP